MDIKSLKITIKTKLKTGYNFRKIFSLKLMGYQITHMSNLNLFFSNRSIEYHQ